MRVRVRVLVRVVTMSIRNDAADKTSEALKTTTGQFKAFGLATGPLFSDAIRFKPGMSPIRASTDAPSNADRCDRVFTPQRAKPTHAPNGGLDIDALVSAAQRTSLAPRSNARSVGARCDALPVEEDVAGACMDELSFEIIDTGRLAEDAVYVAALAARLGADRPVDTEGLVKTLGNIKKWWQRRKSESADKNAAKNAANKAAEEAAEERLDETEGVEEARAMIEAHATEQGVDLRHVDMDTFAMYEHMITAVQHIDALAGVGWEHEVDIGAPAWWERKKQQAKEAMAKAGEKVKKAREAAAGAADKAKAKAAAVAEKAKLAKASAGETAKLAADKAKLAADKARAAADKTKNSDLAKQVGKAKAAVSKFAKVKWQRFTNEDRITKMERYDYTLYSSQPLKKVMIDKKSTTLPFGGKPASDKDPLHDPHTQSVEVDPFFYGMIAGIQKGLVTNAQGDQAFSMDAKEKLDILGSDKYRDVLTIRQPSEDDDPLTALTKRGYMGGTQYGASPNEIIDRIRAQNAVQMHAVPSTADSSQLVYPPDGKPNGAHPLCLGHSMMVPVASLGPPLPYRQNASELPDASMGQANDPFSLVRACVSSEWLKTVERELVASPLRNDFAEVLSAEGTEHAPFIIPMPSKYSDPNNLSASDAKQYKKAFPQIPIVDARPMPAWYKELSSPTYADVWLANEERDKKNGPGINEMTLVDPNASMRPVSALLVVPLEKHIVEQSGAFKRTDEGGIAMEYQRLYPWQPVPAFTKDAQNNPTDTVGDTRKAINGMLKAGENFSRDQLLHLGYAPSVHPTMAKDMPHAPVRFMQSDVDFQSRFEVAVFALGLSPACDAGGNSATCEKALDDVGAGNMLMIGTHPLLLGKQHNGTEYVGFEKPDQVFVSHGNGVALTNALPVALEGEHIDTRFVWASMKLLQRSWSKATNPRVSKPSLARFRKLIGLSREMWQSPDTKFNMSGWEKKRAGRVAAFQRRSASREDEMFGNAMRELGMVNVLTGAELSLHELSHEEFALALERAGIDLDAEDQD